MCTFPIRNFLPVLQRRIIYEDVVSLGSDVIANDGVLKWKAGGPDRSANGGISNEALVNNSRIKLADD